jgi:hypothetical protein
MIENRLLSRPSFLIFVPVLAFVGFLSAILTMRFWYIFTSEYQNEYLWLLLQSVILGLAISTVLWGFRLIRTRVNFICVVAAVVAAHSLEKILDARLPERTYRCWDCDPTGFFSMGVAIRFFLVSAIVFVVTLGLLEPRPKARVLLLASAAGSLLGSVAMGVFDKWLQWTHDDIVFDGRPLSPLWQPTLAASIGIAVWVSSFVRRTPASSLAS